MSDELMLTSGSQLVSGGDGDVISYRNKVIERYRQNRRGINDLLQGGSLTIDDTLLLIAEEILAESEALLGNGLIMTEDGDLEKATNISVKRTDVLKSVADILAKKRELNQKDADVDLNGPAFMIFQKMCFDKMTDTLEELNFDKEMVQLVLSKWVDKLKNWGKELKKELEKL